MAQTFFMENIKMKTKKLVCGVGINNADYVVQKFETIGYIGGKRKRKRVWICPYYQAWVDMLARCYSAKLHARNPTYRGCTVSKEWHTFSNFKAWMEAQDFKGKQLDKDLLFEGNKIYSAETCVFVSPVVNTFTTESKASQGGRMVGVCWHKLAEKFHSSCRNPFSGEQEYLGLFTCEQEAHNAWLKRKLGLARLLAAEQEDPRIAKALIDRYTTTQIKGGDL